MASSQAAIRPTPSAAVGIPQRSGPWRSSASRRMSSLNRLFGRQTPVHPYDLAVLIALGILTGALIATYSIAATAS